MNFFVGVDGGGTRTRAVVVDGSGAELGRAAGRGEVATATSPRDAAEAVLDTVRRAMTIAGVDGPASVLWAGLAGGGQEAARLGVGRVLEASRVARQVIVGTDVEAAFHDAFGEGPGVLLIAGTGSIAWARDEDGTLRRVGGWGHRLGDEGSGYSLGRAGLNAVLRASDGRAGRTSLEAVLREAVGVERVEELVGWIESAGKGPVAGLAPLVVAAADAGDEVASVLVADAVAALLDHVRAAAPDGGSIVLWGGLIADGGPLEVRLGDALRNAGYTVAERSLDPGRGAALMALRQGD